MHHASSTTTSVVVAERQPRDRTEQRGDHAVAVRVTGRPLTVKVGFRTSRRGGAPSRCTGTRSRFPGMATLALLVLEALFVRRWLPALVHLERTADRVGAGDLTPVPREPMPSRELEHLRDAFADMVDRLRAASAGARARRWRKSAGCGARSSRCSSRSSGRNGSPRSACCSRASRTSSTTRCRRSAGFSEILQRDPDIGAQARSDLALIKKESARASAIIRNLSRFSRQQGSTPTTVLPTRRRRVGRRAAPAPAAGAEHPPRARRAGDPVRRSPCSPSSSRSLLNFLVNAEQSLVANRPRTRSTHRHSHPRHGTRRPARGRGQRPGRAGRARIEALPAVLHDQAHRRGHGARPLGELWHRAVVRRDDRVPARATWTARCSTWNCRPSRWRP